MDGWYIASINHQEIWRELAEHFRSQAGLHSFTFLFATGLT
jgi:hypothetical protein